MPTEEVLTDIDTTLEKEVVPTPCCVVDDNGEGDSVEVSDRNSSNNEEKLSEVEEKTEDCVIVSDETVKRDTPGEQQDKDCIVDDDEPLVSSYVSDSNKSSSGQQQQQQEEVGSAEISSGSSVVLDCSSSGNTEAICGVNNKRMDLVVGGGICGPSSGLLVRYSQNQQQQHQSLGSAVSPSVCNDDRGSDSGVSCSLRSSAGSSGDERSGSRSSALSSSDLEPNVVSTLQGSGGSSNSSTSSTSSSSSSLGGSGSASLNSLTLQQQASQNSRSPLFIPSVPASSPAPTRYHQQQQQHQDVVASANAAPSTEPVRVWRDPNLLLEEPHVRHINSIQHQTLLMSHSGGAPASSGPTQSPSAPGGGSHPVSSSSAASLVVGGSAYPPPPPPSLIGTHPLSSSAAHHPHLPPHASLYHAASFDMLWKRGGSAPAFVPTAHLMSAAAAAAAAQQGSAAEDMLAERALAMQDRDRQERIFRERQNQEQQKEKARLERDKLERDKLERQRQEREKDLEKERQKQALQNHFEKSLRQLKREQWDPITGRPSQPRSSGLSEEDRKRTEEMQQRHMSVRTDARDHRSYYGSVQRPTNVPVSKSDYPPPPAHSRHPPSSKSASMDKMTSQASLSLHHPAMSKNEPSDIGSMYGYPPSSVSHQPQAPQQASYYEAPKSNKSSPSSGISVSNKGPMDGRELVSEIKNSVIVKHDTKNPHHLESRLPSMSHSSSPSPKLRNDMLSHHPHHYLAAAAAAAAAQSQSGSQNKDLFEYRSPTQSPHHHLPNPHQHHMTADKQHHQRQLPSPHQHHHQRQSPHQPQPHPHAQPHPSPELRYGRAASDGQAMIYQVSGGKSSYPFTTVGAPAAYTTISPAPPLSGAASNLSTTSTSKPKVSSPAPHQFFGKPQLCGAVSMVPVPSRPQATVPPHESSSSLQLITPKPPLSSSVSPSPYQQVSQYHPPHNPQSPLMTCPPPAHSNRPASSTAALSAATIVDRYDRAPSYVPSGLSVRLVGSATSPPTGASAPLNSRQPQQAPFVQNLTSVQQVQTQPLDLGVSSNKFENPPPSISPKRKSSTPLSHPGSPVCLEVKKRRIDTPPHHLIGTAAPQQPQLARVSEPSPLMSGASATTITTLVNTAAVAATYRTPPPSQQIPVVPVVNPSTPTAALLSENLPDVSVTAVTVESTPVPRPPSAEVVVPPSPKPATPTMVAASSSPPPMSTTSTPTPPTSVTPGPAEESPGTPIKVNLTPSVVDSEKSNSPGPQKTSSSTYPVRHLKKAWLQRHTGEDTEDTTGMVGSGSCVSLPLNIKTNLPPTTTISQVPKENPVNSIHSVGSMAVNSINKPKHFSSKAASRKAAKEAAINGDAKNDDSSSSDQERGRKSPPKRKPPKVKRKKGASLATKKTTEDKKKKSVGQTPTAVASESGSDSEKESGSDKDSDSGASASAPTKKSGGGGSGKEPRKRGRRPKSSKNDKGDEPRPKKLKDDSDERRQNAPPPPPPAPPRDPFRKPPIAQLKRTGESFLQDGPCFEVAPKLAKCRECRWTPNQRSKNMPNIFCRFYAFRRLRYTKNGQLAIAGFSDPHKDAMEEDIKLWLPNPDNPPADLDLETSRFLLKQVGDHFCDLLVQEKDANAEHMSDDKIVAWKRVVQGVREMCDVCETTLFNFHWACGKCGFVICIDCYKSRKKGSIKVWGEPGKDRDEFSWLLCTNRQAHEQEKLMLTQIIAGDSLVKLGGMVHEMRDLWNIEQFCGCPSSKEPGSKKSSDLRAKEIVKMILGDKVNGIKREPKDEDDPSTDRDDKKEGSSSSEEEGGNFSTLRELLIRPSHKPNGSRAASPVVTKNESKKKPPPPLTKPADLDDVISSVIEDSVPHQNKAVVEVVVEPKSELKHFVRRYNWQGKGRVQLPIRIMTLTESKMLYPDIPHSWLCDGKLLRLSDPQCSQNYKIFQDQWKRGQPVIVSDVTRDINNDLWNPDSFARDFGEEKNDLINCMTGNLVPNQPMRKFWEGFDHFSKRLKDDRGHPMLLKLKDWPPGEDFAEMLPSRYTDLMKVLPLSEYTHRTGRLNLASRLPDCFVRPDLGPKMYNAYGSALHPSKGTTNLHLDISDAVNVMVYVGIPKDGDTDEHIKEAFRAIDEAGCDILTRRRVRDKGELPGALWHIYAARDADKIRDLLNKVVVEKGGRLEPHHDPIHDQSCYLDGPLRERLYKEYGVEGYAIVQCKGDAVFIPAGAPHQVRNLHNCIKVAEDFVSPENVSHCFHLTQEFRDLSDTHSNHEDKLQIKNIIYHAVKDSLSSLVSIINKHCDVSSVKSEKDSSSSEKGGSECENSSSKSDSNEAT